ncbi:MAG: arsenate reductase (glutaredoxin) [Marinifilaceae bacterium]|jgi:arsenate reductase|nr:arsenate reductase (glutaredoxin) [Marinifilaceae bacterium]
MYTIYHNPRCAKSRDGLKYLQEKTEEIEIKLYLKDGLTEMELEEILKKLNLSPEQIVRKQEKKYKEDLKDQNFNFHEWLKIIKENPKLLQRPIVIKDYKAVIANPVSEIDKL